MDGPPPLGRSRDRGSPGKSCPRSEPGASVPPYGASRATYAFASVGPNGGIVLLRRGPAKATPRGGGSGDEETAGRPRVRLLSSSATSSRPYLLPSRRCRGLRPID